MNNRKLATYFNQCCSLLLFHCTSGPNAVAQSPKTPAGRDPKLPSNMLDINPAMMATSASGFLAKNIAQPPSSPQPTEYDVQNPHPRRGIEGWIIPKHVTV